MITLSDLRKVLGLALIVSVALFGVFVSAEPAISIAASASTSVVVTLSVTTGVSITANAPTTAMSTALGVVSNDAVATSTFVVTTNSALGYTLALNATSTPAMQNLASSTQSIPDMASSSPALWAVPAASYVFGFSAFSTSTSDVPTATWGTAGTGCANGGNNPSATLKYRGFAGAIPYTIASNNATTSTSGTPIVVCFAVGQNGAFVPSGSYNATVVATATTN